MPPNNNSNEAGQESLAESSACCPSADAGGSCCSGGSDTGRKSWKLLIFIVIVVAAGAVLARSFMKKSDSTTDQGQGAFAAIQPQEKSDVSSPLTTVAEQAPADSKGTTGGPSAANALEKTQVADNAPLTFSPKPLDSLASLSKIAPTTDAVFILLGSKNQLDAQPITSQVEAAAKKIQAGGIRISAFTLSQNAPSYAQLAKQFPVPSVLAMVKGRGASGVSGEITETKLIQAFVTASRPASGCCPPGSGVKCD